MIRYLGKFLEFQFFIHITYYLLYETTIIKYNDYHKQQSFIQHHQH